MDKQNRAARKKFHYIYVTTCKVTGRYYIGMHSTDDLDDGYIGSGKRLWSSIKKYGAEQHVCEVLEFCASRAELRKREAEHVNEERLKVDPFCMNLAVGGEGGWERCNTKLTKEQRFKISAAGAKVRNTIFAKGTEAAKKRSALSVASWQKNYKAGLTVKPPGFAGQKHSTDALVKMSERGKVRRGENNPRFGTCWIKKGEQRKSIKLALLEEHLQQGWVRGR